MNHRSYLLFTLVISVAAVLVLAWAVRAGNPVVAVLVLVIAAAVLYYGRRRVVEVIEDERDLRINERAAKRALDLFGLLGILVAVFLYAVSTPESDFTREGLTLGLAVSLLILLYAGFQAHYSRVPGMPR
jgi:uncharacterized membrane protein